MVIRTYCDNVFTVEPFGLDSSRIPFYEHSQREDFLKRAHNNVWLLNEEEVTFDLSGIGTGAMDGLQQAVLNGYQPLHKLAIKVTAYDTNNVLVKCGSNLKSLERTLGKAKVHLVFLTVTGKYPEITDYGVPYANDLLDIFCAYMQNLQDICELCHKHHVLVSIDKVSFVEVACFFDSYVGAHDRFTDILRYADFFGDTNNPTSEVARPIPSIEWEVELEHMRQVDYLAAKLYKCHIPFHRPVDYASIMIDACRVFYELPRWQFPALTLVCELYLKGGIRACEFGYVLNGFGRESSIDQFFDDNDFVRLCLPHQVYTYSHINLIAAVLEEVFERRSEIKRGCSIVSETNLLRQDCWFKRW